MKKVADMARFATHVAEFRNHVQDAYYREGFQQQYGKYPLFVFIAVSESIDCGRYPVRVFQLSEDDVAVGYDQFRRDLRAYHACRESDNWGGIEEITRPEWAKRKDLL